MKTPARIASLLVALIGLGISAYLTWTHHQLHTDPTFVSFCNINEVFNCDAVALSAFSTVWGIPLALFGMAFYVAIALLAVIKKVEAQSLAWGLSILAVILSVVLAVISKTVIGSWCVLCIGLYIVNAVLMGTTWKTLGQPLGAMVATLEKALRGAAKNSAAYGAFIAFVGVLWIGAAVLDAGPALPALPASGSAQVDGAKAADAAEDEKLAGMLIEAHLSSPVQNIPLSGLEASKGNPKAPLVLVEFADFECPYCSRAADALDQVAQTFKDDIHVIYKHFPLDKSCNPGGGMHEFSCQASLGAICAQAQGQFWPYHHRVFGSQKQISAETLPRWAEELGLDMAAWTACLESPEAESQLKADIEAAHRLQLQGTPALFINGREHKSKAIIDARLMEILVLELLDGADR